jgi:hypothetical protein
MATGRETGMSEEARSDLAQQVRSIASGPPEAENHLANGIALAILNAMVEGRGRQQIEDQLLHDFNVSPEVLGVCITAFENLLRRHDEWQDAALTGSSF